MAFKKQSKTINNNKIKNWNKEQKNYIMTFWI
jgi:uncharacterized protein YfeS